MDSGDEAEVPDLPDRTAYFAEYKKAVEAEYRAYTIDQGCDRVHETEETVVTPAMRRIEAEDPDRHLVGLDFRLKGRERLAEKVGNWLKADAEMTAERAFGLVKDAIRYTFQYTEEHYTAGVYADCNRLEAAGFERVERRNSWEKEEYKGLNGWWRVPGNGQVFEVQFHTRASFETKQLTHPAYEKLRDPATSKAEQEELADFQRKVSARVPVPPGATDIPVVRPLSQAGYRPLLEAGVRVFEWKGSMLHAKTAVADGRWARVGSSNLNIASWIGNYELDALVEDRDFAGRMERMYEDDLANATEIVLRRRRSRLAAARHYATRPLLQSGDRARVRGSRSGGSASRAAAGALRLGRAVGAALTDQRVLAPTESRLVAIVGAIVLGLAVATVIWPLIAAVPLAILLAWIAFALFVKALALRRERRVSGLPATRVERKPAEPDATHPLPGDASRR